MMCGGVGSEKEVTPEVQTICEELKEEIVKNSSKENFEVFKTLKYKSQMVSGTNYFVKIQVTSGGDCIHVRIYEPLPCNNDTNQRAFLHGLQESKGVTDAVDYFDNNLDSQQKV